MKLQTLKDIDSLKDKRVIVRTDFNVPLDSEGNIRNDDRIKFALPTIEYLIAHEASQIIVMAHVGRPKLNEENLKTDKIAERLSELIGVDVDKVDNWGETGMPGAKIVMLENLRFHPGEKSKDEAEKEAFAKQLASLADIYVEEAFSNCHRDHASMTGVPKLIPGYVGLGTEKEYTTIEEAIESPKKPLVAVIAGAKADKLTAISNMLEIADHILIGGALAFALRSAQGYNVGSSMVDQEGLDSMAELVEMINKSNKVMLPNDAAIAHGFKADAKHKVVNLEDGIEQGWMALDIGPETIDNYSKVISEAESVLWFGPLGVFEWENFSSGTKKLGEAMVESGAMVIVGGGDSATAVKKFGLEKDMSHVSTGGGASLKIIEGKTLPAIEILKR